MLDQGWAGFKETCISYARKEDFMNRIFASILLMFSAIAFAQAPQIKSGSTIFIEPTGGYETYLAAAVLKKKVPVFIVLDKDKADYIIQIKGGHVDLNNPAPVVAVNNTINTQPQTPGNSVQQAMQRGYEAGAAERRALGETVVSMAVIDPRSSTIIFAHSTNKAGPKQISESAEDCAKHLKEFIEKSEKPKK